jgi:hypothetical protein
MHNHNRQMPSWAEKIDAHGKRHWCSEKSEKSRTGEYIAAILFNLLFLWIVNNILDWHTGFITERFMVVLWIINVSIFVKIGGNAMMLLFDMRFVRRLSTIAMEVASFVVQMSLYYIYPFDFSHLNGLVWLDWFLPIMLIIGMVVSAVKVVSQFWKLLFRR